jgi:hypothetical protein
MGAYKRTTVDLSGNLRIRELSTVALRNAG